MTLTSGQQKVLDTLKARFGVDFVPILKENNEISFVILDMLGVDAEHFLVSLRFWCPLNDDKWAFCSCAGVSPKEWNVMCDLFS